MKMDVDEIDAYLRSMHVPEIPEAPVYGNFFCSSLLIQLADKSRLDIIKLLVEHGADVDYGNPHFPANCDCSTPLHFAGQFYI